jgi:hypothetical protein
MAESNTAKLTTTLVHYAKMSSTWRGVALLAGAFGVYMDPALLETVAAGVLALIGLIETVRKD